MTTGIFPFCGKRVDKFIMYRGDIVGCRYCGIHTKQTNADRIRAMSDEDLAEWVNGIMFNGTNRYGEIRKRLISNEFLEWLKEEVKDG